MRKLKKVLEEALPDVTSLGGRSTVDRDRLLGLLRRLREELSRAYWLRAAITLLVVAILIAITWRYGQQPGPLTGGLCAMSIVFVGALLALQKVADEAACVDMILGLAADLNLEALTEVAYRIAAPL